jgi:hypothetical protein
MQDKWTKKNFTTSTDSYMRHKKAASGRNNMRQNVQIAKIAEMLLVKNKTHKFVFNILLNLKSWMILNNSYECY